MHHSRLPMRLDVQWLNYTLSDTPLRYRAVIKYEGADLVLDSTGQDYEEFLSKFTGMISMAYNAYRAIFIVYLFLYLLLDY